MEDMTAVVLDAGSGHIKAGFAGDGRPATVFCSSVGRPKNTQVMIAIGTKDTFIGDEAQNKRGLMHLNYPIQHGVIQDWDDMEMLWDHTFHKSLLVAPEEHHMLLTEAALNPKANRDKMVQIMFEKYNAPYLFVVVNSFLSLYATGRTTGVVVDSGAGLTSAFPIYDGYGLPNSIARVDAGGHDLNTYMMKILNERGLTMCGSAEFELCRDIKERFGYVSRNYEAELKFSQTNPAEVEQTYTLPDGQPLKLTTEHFRCAEALFKPSVIGIEGHGIHEVCFDAIMKVAVDLRSSLYSNIVLCGGNTCFRGMVERFKLEMQRLAPSTVHAQMNVSTPNDIEKRKHLSWIGGSILASIMQNHPTMWVSRDEWAEHGNRILARKCY